MSTTLPATIERERGVAERREFTGTEITVPAEVAASAIAAREQAETQAAYIMAERHPRSWPNVRVAMMDHCKRPRFAETARWRRPVGKKLVDGKWQEEIAVGFSVNFTDALLQEVGNLKTISQAIVETADVRVIRFGVVDMQRNVLRYREVTFEKAVEKRAWKDKQTNEEKPPEGREVLSSRVASDGHLVFLVRATADEMRNRVNAEESKSIRDLVRRLCPRDILEDCEAQIVATLKQELKTDPEAAVKRMYDSFANEGILPTQLQTYVGKAKFNEDDITELRGLYTAIHEGQITFDEALKMKYDTMGQAGHLSPEEVAKQKLAEAEAKAKAKAAASPAAQSPSQPSASEQPVPTVVPAAKEEKDAGGHTLKPPPVAFPGTEWPDNPPEDRPWTLAGKTYMFNEASGNHQIIATDDPAPKPAPGPGRLTFGRKPKTT